MELNVTNVIELCDDNGINARGLTIRFVNHCVLISCSHMGDAARMAFARQLQRIATDDDLMWIVDVVNLSVRIQ